MYDVSLGSYKDTTDLFLCIQNSMLDGVRRQVNFEPSNRIIQSFKSHYSTHYVLTLENPDYGKTIFSNS